MVTDFCPYGVFYERGTAIEKAVFHALRLGGSPVYRFLHYAFWYAGAVFEFDPGPVDNVVALAGVDTFVPWAFVPWSHEATKRPLPVPNTGISPTARLLFKAMLVVLGLPLLLLHALIRQWSFVALDCFRTLERVGRYGF